MELKSDFSALSLLHDTTPCDIPKLIEMLKYLQFL